MAAMIKTEPKEANLVSSSMMLVNNPVSENMSFYPESSSNMATSRCSTSTAEDYHNYYRENIPHSYGPFSYGTYYPYSYTPVTGSSQTAVSKQNCNCQSVPMQQSFLHQILTGKGYRNDRLFVSVRPVIKQERSYEDYRACFGYAMGYNPYGYPVYH